MAPHSLSYASDYFEIMGKAILTHRLTAVWTGNGHDIGKNTHSDSGTIFKFFMSWVVKIPSNSVSVYMYFFLMCLFVKEHKLEVR